MDFSQPKHRLLSYNATSAGTTTAAKKTAEKEESPPKKQRVERTSSGASAASPAAVAAASAASSAPVVLPPMPSTVRAMLSTFELELESRVERLQSQTQTLVDSLKRTFQNEVNKVPTKVRALTLEQFLDASRYAGNPAFVMDESAMRSQGALESWVQATPSLRTNKKIRSMIAAAPSHANLLATNQRLTRASARKMGVTGVTGLGLSSSLSAVEESEGPAPMDLEVPATARPAIVAAAPVTFETPSARGKARPRVAQAAAAVAPVVAAATGSVSMASLMAAARKKAVVPVGSPAPAAATAAPIASPAPVSAPAAAPAPTHNDEPDVESENIVPANTAAVAVGGKKKAAPRGAAAKKTAAVAKEAPIAVAPAHVPIVAAAAIAAAEKLAAVEKEVAPVSKSNKTAKVPSPRVTRARAAKAGQ